MSVLASCHITTLYKAEVLLQFKKKTVLLRQIWLLAELGQNTTEIMMHCMIFIFLSALEILLLKWVTLYLDGPL